MSYDGFIGGMALMALVLIAADGALLRVQQWRHSKKPPKCNEQSDHKPSGEKPRIIRRTEADEADIEERKMKEKGWDPDAVN